MAKIGNALDLCENFLKTARAARSGMGKTATDPSDPTSHPVMKADDGTQPAREGSRSAENEADIKKHLGNAGMTGQEDAGSASGKQPSDTMGTHKMEADEMGGNAKEPKAKKDEPGKHTGGPESPGHPSNATFSEKYSAVADLNTQILTRLTQLGVKTASAPAPAVPAPAPASAPASAPAPMDKAAAAEKYREDAEAGYVAAELLARGLGFDKEAEAKEQAVNAAIDQGLGRIIKAAQDVATNYSAFHLNYVQSLTKKAEGEGGGGGEGGAETPPEALAAAAGPEAGPPPEGGEGGPQNEEAILDAVAKALAEAGVTPEELAAAVEQAQGGEGGGGLEGAGAGAGAGAAGIPEGLAEAGGAAGGPPPGIAEKAGSVGTKVAAAIKQVKTAQAQSLLKMVLKQMTR